LNTETSAWIGLGANLGDAAATLEAAFGQLARLPQTRLVARSTLYRTAPVDATGPDYLNAVAGLETRLSPGELLSCLHDIERAHGRDRPFHHAPRTLDLDLLLHGHHVIRTPQLCVPHPRMHLRAFVLAPLLEVAPALVHPELGPLAPWLARAADQGVTRLVP
jgi:2-amino-4-hydroxy-6-hydroxymethyldihydropteridine diphosphokinase